MGEIPAAVRTFVRRVRERYPDARIFLFGSRAKGTARDDSDWDFIIVTEKFQNTRRVRRAVAMDKLAPLVLEVDFLCYTPEEFEKRKRGPTIVNEAICEGSLIELTT